MSCTCKPSYYNIPCCCPKPITTTTTIMPDDTVCEEVYGSSSIYYPFVDPDCLGLPANANLTQILVAIMQSFPQCTTTTSTTTSTTTTTTMAPIPCDEGSGCPIGYTCVNGFCQLIECSEDGDCAIGFVCINGICVPTTTTTSTTSTTTTTAAPNSPCNSYALEVTSNCSYQNYNNLNSSNNFTAPTPSCGNYLGGDVWFNITVPSSGQVVVSLQAGTITNAALAVYSGSCSSLTEIVCADYTSGNPMPNVTLSGLTPGDVLFIRVWSFGNVQSGSFGICSINPVLNPCTISGTAVNVLCLTTTTTTVPLSVPECGVIYLAYYTNTTFRGSDVYYYDVNANTSTLLPVPGLGFNAQRYLDIAHTANKMWLCDPPNSAFVEYDILLSPWTAIYNRSISFPANYASSSGLHAIDNNTLLTVNIFDYLADPDHNPVMVTEYNVNTNALNPKFPLTLRRIVHGDFLLTSNGKFIVTTLDNNNNIYISQYDYATGFMEFDLLISGTLPGPSIIRPYGMFESGGDIYITNGTSGIYRVNTTYPYARTFVGIPVGGYVLESILGASQLTSCSEVSFTPNITTTTSTTTTSTTTTSTTTTTTTVNPECNCSCITFVNTTSSSHTGSNGITWLSCSDDSLNTRDMAPYEIFYTCGKSPVSLDGAVDIRLGSELCGDPCDPCYVNCASKWSTQNLDVTTYANGDPIPEVSDSTAWSNLTTGAWCYYANNSANGVTYGRLYNHYALTDPRGLNIPSGYRLPTTVDWMNLKNCVGNVSEHLKSTSGWVTGLYGNGNNITGFNALPGGIRNGIGGFTSVGGNGYWWALDGGTRVFMGTNFSTISTVSGSDLRYGLSVRLIQI